LSWENTDAVHLPKTKQLIIAEKLRNRRGKPWSSPRVEGNLRHETGHAFDMLVGGQSTFQSSSAAFARAYRADLERARSGQFRRQLAYFTQATSAGPQEAFAEAFAIQYGGGSDPQNEQDFLTAFPRVVRFVRTVVENYAPDPSSSGRTISPSPPTLALPLSTIGSDSENSSAIPPAWGSDPLPAGDSEPTRPQVCPSQAHTPP
jgi:hypothetical protein